MKAILIQEVTLRSTQRKGLGSLSTRMELLPIVQELDGNINLTIIKQNFKIVKITRAGTINCLAKSEIIRIL